MAFDQKINKITQDIERQKMDRTNLDLPKQIQMAQIEEYQPRENLELGEKRLTLTYSAERFDYISY